MLKHEDMDRKDLRFDYTNNSRLITLTIVHDPTGLEVSATGASKCFLREMLLPMLEYKVTQAKW